MRIDAAIAQNPRINDLAAAQTREIAGERENDGDSDDLKAAAPAANRMDPAGVGTKVDILA